MITTFLIAYFIVGLLWVAEGMRKSNVVLSYYRLMAFPVFIMTFVISAWVWAPIMAWVAVTPNRPKEK